MIERYPALESCRKQIEEAVKAIVDMHSCKGTLLICGNGGSAADCEHISGELLKGFLKKRPLNADQAAGLPEDIAAKLQGGIRAIPLTSLSALGTAFSNDVDPELIYAQLVYSYGTESCVFLGLSTSGNANNVCAAAKVARAKGMKTIAMTGEHGGALAELCDVAIKVPERETYKVQELHLPVYHAICAEVEEIIFG